MTASNLHAGLVSITGAWTGAPYSNGATVTLAADIDLSSPAFDLGATAGKAHQWWWAAGPTTFTNVVVFVMGATIDPTDNAIFGTSAFNWFRIASNAATSDQALTDLTNIIDLGNSGSDGRAPSDSGAGVMQLGAGNGGHEYVASLGAKLAGSPVPEPGSFVLGGLGLASLVFLQRRRARG